MALSIASMIMAISFPSVTRGLDGVRLRSGAQQTAAFINQTRARADREQVPVELAVDPVQNRMSALAADGVWQRVLELPQDVRIAAVEPAVEGVAVRRFMILPGVPTPRFRVRLESPRGRWATAAVDPLTGVPQIEGLQ